MKSKRIDEKEFKRMLYDDFYGDEILFWKELEKRRKEKRLKKVRKNAI